MSRRRARRQRKAQQPPVEPEESVERRPWLRPRTAIIVIAALALFNAGNVFRGVYKAADPGTTVVYTLLAFATPALAAGLAYLILRRMAR